MKSVLEPTGTCFEDTTQIFIQMIAADRKLWGDRTFVMVHSICLMPDGTRYSHAWVEHGSRVLFRGIINGEHGHYAATKEEFYKEFQVQETTKYTAEEAMHVALRNGDRPPPWEKKYLALCKDYKGKKWN